MEQSDSIQIPGINIRFEDLSYSVYNDRKEKKILNNVTGHFKSGEISAILGPSGAGKTTLLNILAGFESYSATGSVLINGQERNLKQFRKISRYIQQEITLQSLLTVDESMQFAATFKLGYRISKQEKDLIISQILKTLRLTNCKNTKTEKLSGGERKRLSISLELINNPSVIFLDEPTSGLDELSSYQCIYLLKQLAEQGRTVICSIHAPSAKIFALFQHLYIVSEGQCVYQGIGNEILSFLKRIHLECPVYYNPIDFFIDVACDEYGPQVDKLIALTDNGKLSYSENIVSKYSELQLDINERLINLPEYSSSTWTQCLTLLRRVCLQSRRNWCGFSLRCVLIAIVITSFSLLFYNIGNNATKLIENIGFSYLTIVSFVYCSLIPPLIHYPLDFKIARSEHFNQWYNLKSYFIAKTLEVLPYFIIFSGMFVLIVYPMTGQPLDCERMLQFFTICMFTTLVSDSISQMVGSLFNIVNAIFFGTAIIVAPVILAIQGFGHNVELIPQVLQYLIRTSFVRFCLEGLLASLYHRRENISCPEEEIFCPLIRSDDIMNAFGFGVCEFWTSLGWIFMFYVGVKVFTLYVLKERFCPSKITQRIMHVKNFILEQMKYYSNV